MKDKSPKQDAQTLVDEFIVFAEKMLRENGEFYPFGGYMKPDGEVVWEGASDGTDHPRSARLIEILRESHRQLALRDQIRASCIVYDILTVPPEREVKQDAIAIEIDHRDGYSATVVFPYTLSPGLGLTVEDPFAVSRLNSPFTPPAGDGPSR